MVCHKYSAHTSDPVAATDAGAMTGMWSDLAVGRPERRFLGAASMYGLYSRFGQATPRGVQGFIVYRDDHWLLEGTGLRYGDVLGHDDGVVGYENVGTRLAFDERNLPVAVLDPSLPGDALPESVEVVAFTPASNLAMGEYPASIAALDDQGDIEFIAERRVRRWAAGDGEGPPRQRRDPHRPPLGRCRRSGGHGREHRLGVRVGRRRAGRPGHGERTRPARREPLIEGPASAGRHGG